MHVNKPSANVRSSVPVTLFIIGLLLVNVVIMLSYCAFPFHYKRELLMVPLMLLQALFIKLSAFFFFFFYFSTPANIGPHKKAVIVVFQLLSYGNWSHCGILISGRCDLI